MMTSIKDTTYYNLIEWELEREEGIYYLTDRLVIAEIHENVTFSWDNHGRSLTEEIIELNPRESNGECIYISNRIHKYSVNPTDWFKFSTFNQLLGYGIVNNRPAGHLSARLESMFLNCTVEHFTDISDAMDWALHFLKSFEFEE